MLVDSVGVYVTETGDIVYVTKTDGYRRCYGYLKDKPEIELSWYTKDGIVRHGACSQRLVCKLNLELPPAAHERGVEAQEDYRKSFADKVRYRSETVQMSGSSGPIQAAVYWRRKYEEVVEGGAV